MKSKPMIAVRSIVLFLLCSILVVSGAWAKDPAGEPGRSSGKKNPLKNVYFGDTHLHTQNSPDAYLFGVRLGPDEALRFARGEQVTATHGLPVKLVRPLDFLVVADHSEYLGFMSRLFSGDPQILSTEYAKKVYDIAQSGKDGPFKAAMEVIATISKNQEKLDTMPRSV